MKRKLLMPLVAVNILGLLSACSTVTVTEPPEESQTEEMHFETPAAAEAPVGKDVYITLSAAGVKELDNEYIFAEDKDGNGTVTIQEAVEAAHELFYTGSEEGCQFKNGKPVTLWGQKVTNGYGAYVNESPVKKWTTDLETGDSLIVYSGSEEGDGNDIYCLFEENNVSTITGERIELTLKALVVDEEGESSWEPLSGAEILIDGESAGVKTDNNGKFHLTFEEVGTFTISAVSSKEGTALIPPACVVTVSEVPAESPAEE